MRVKFEFHCSNCSKYFDIKLNMSLNGNYRIHCPNCEHVHYRQVKNGQITDNRFPQNDDQILIEDIRPMKSSCRDLQTEKATCTTDDPGGFLRQSWLNKFSWLT
jgi:DNA-directed RNA polymerase subunit RPC12/RpoP